MSSDADDLLDQANDGADLGGFTIEISQYARQKWQEQARAIVARKLDRRDHTRHELEQALRKKEIPDDIAAEMLDYYEEIGLVDDADFARRWVQSRTSFKSLGKRALWLELYRKGISKTLIDEVLEGVSEEDEYELALRFARSRLGRVRGLPMPQANRRLAGMLARKGFPAQIVYSVTKEVLDEPDRWSDSDCPDMW